MPGGVGGVEGGLGRDERRGRRGWEGECKTEAREARKEMVWPENLTP